MANTYKKTRQTKGRKPKLVQYIPDGPFQAFEVVVPFKGETYWHFRLADGIDGADCFWEYPEPRHFDRPEYRYHPPKKGCPFTVEELAKAAAVHLNEGRGWLTVQEIQDGVCVFAAVFASNSRHVFCIQSTDAARTKLVDVQELATRAREALEQARQERAKRVAS